MVILIASDQADACQALAEHLAADGKHRIYTAGTMTDLEEAAASLEELEVLLFSASFSKGRGKELRDALRAQFPGLQTGLITEEDGQTVPPQKVAEWLAEFESKTSVDAEGPVILGDYELMEKRRTTPTTDTFRAVQRSVNREVVLERLKPELCRDKAAVRAFRGMVRARANVSCPWIAAVYEAQETDDALFYTRELVRGITLDELAASRAHITPEEALHLLRAAGEAMTWLQEKNLPRTELKRQHLYHGHDGAPRIANIAAADVQPVDEPAEIRAMAAGLMRVVDFNARSARESSHVLGLMKASGPHALTTWKAVLREVSAGLHRLTEARSSSLAGDSDSARPRRRKSRAVLFGAAALTVLAGGLVIAWYSRKPNPAKPRNLAAMVEVNAGEFTFGDGHRLTLPGFWIDSHEVTIGQYAEFLTAIAGINDKKFDHADQPKEKTGHEPKDWADIHAAARAGSTWRSCPISLHCPVFNVDWWDAYAFAAWKGRRLPSEQEWEKAARGTNGRRWPWGSEADPKRANTGADYAEQPGGGGKIDGFTWWCEVDAKPEDVSPWNVYGMAGNVAEWTDTRAPHPDLPDETVPVYRGGDFYQDAQSPLTTQRLAKSAAYAQPFLGFRTASSNPPSPQE